MDRAEAVALAEDARGELLALLEALIRESSPAGSSAAGAQAVLRGYLEPSGFQTELHADDPEALRDHPEFAPAPPVNALPVNLTARPVRAAALDLVLFAHVDTESAGTGWTSAPQRPVRKGPRIHGLGAADDKGGLAAAAVAAAVSARRLGRAPILLSIHGKGGGARGTLPAFDRLGDRVAGAIYVHPPENGAGLAVLKTASRGVLDLDLRVRGWRGPPREIGTPESAAPEDGGDALAASLEIVEAVRRALPEAQIHLGQLQAGDAPGRTPVDAAAAVRVLFDRGLTVPDVLAACRDAAADLARSRRSPHGTFRIHVAPRSTRANPARTAWDAPVCRRTRAAVAAVTGKEPQEYAEHLASDIRFPLRLARIPSVGIGCRAGNFYGPDEWVDAEDLIRLTAVLIAVLAAWPTRT